MYLNNFQLMFVYMALKNLQWYMIYKPLNSPLSTAKLFLVSNKNLSCCKFIWFHLILPWVGVNISWWVSHLEQVLAYLEADYVSSSLFFCRLNYPVFFIPSSPWLMLSKQFLLFFSGLSTICPQLFESRDVVSQLRLSQDSVAEIRAKGGVRAFAKCFNN